MLTTEALDAINDFSGCAEPGALLDVLGHRLNSFGTEFFGFNFFPEDGQRFDEAMLAVRVPQNWLDLYLAQDFGHWDPAIRHCREVVYPFAWSDTPYDVEREPRAKEVVERVIDFRLTKGLMVPFPGPKGCIGSIWMGGYAFEPRQQDIPTLHMVGIYAFESLRRMLNRAEPRPVQLTEREREVLTWLATGRSAKEIGRVLNLSHRTVECHFQRAALKLNAKNRTQAVMIALRDHLIAV